MPSVVGGPKDSFAQEQPAGASSLQLGGVGEAHFASSCTAEAQAQLDLAVTLLHSFWRQPALDAFTHVAQLDPSCGLADWGTAMALLINPFAVVRPSPNIMQAGRAAVAHGRLIGAGSPRERDYIEAIGAFYDPPDDILFRDRWIAYEQAMERLSQRYPEDTEGAIFYALSLITPAFNDERQDPTYAKPLQAAALLEELYPQQPDHPGITHYLIHAFDYPPLAPRGLDAARRYAALAPTVPHALHMPSHIFTQLGLWDESIATNRASLAAEADPGQASHAVDFLVYAYLQLAQDEAAADLLGAYAALAPAGTGVPLATAAIRARYVLERDVWADAVALPLFPREAQFIASAGATYFARALGAARSHNRDAAAQNLDVMADLVRTAGANDAYWAEQVGIWRQEAQAWLALHEGDEARAREGMRDAAHREERTHNDPAWAATLVPARELYGELLLELGDFNGALEQFDASLNTAPNRFRSLGGAARAAEGMGNRQTATSYYRRLLAQTEHADTDRPELEHARDFLAAQ